ncbi:MAG: rod shape-determining protein MreD [Candidatus Latescibacterota bacterium]|jgi:rod shape-determining protein MreD
MNTVRHTLLLLLSFVLQTTWVELMEISSLKPDLILLVLIYAALREGPLTATVLGFAVGFLQDIYMPTDLGLNALVKSAVGFTIGYGRSRIVGDNIQVQVILILGTVLVHDLVYYIGTSAISLVELPFFWLRYSLGRAIYTGLIGSIFSAASLVRRRILPI